MIGQRIHYLRSRLEVSSELLSSRSKISKEYLDQIESGAINTLAYKDLSALANALSLRGATEVGSFLHLNGYSRRIHAYGVGLMKSGTVSLAGMFSNYKNGHEYMNVVTQRKIMRFHHSKITQQEMMDFFLLRDAVGRLEMDVAFFHVNQIDIISSACPNAKFIYLIRDCHSWLNSFLNYFIFGVNGICNTARDHLLPGGKLIPFDLPAGKNNKEKKMLLENMEKYIEIPLLHWCRVNSYLMSRLPKKRTLLVRTHELTASIPKIAAFLDISPETICKQNSYQNTCIHKVDFCRKYSDCLTKHQDKCDEVQYLLQTY